MNESGFNTAVCKKLQPMLTDIGKIWKVRDDHQTGVPDNFFMDVGKTMWIEFKYLKALPKRGYTPIKINLSEMQKKWLLNLVENNEEAYVLVGVGMGSLAEAVILTPQEAIDGISTDDFRSMSVRGYQGIAEAILDKLHG